MTRRQEERQAEDKMRKRKAENLPAVIMRINECGGVHAAGLLTQAG